jgi:WD40 repeat protein
MVIHTPACIAELRTHRRNLFGLAFAPEGAELVAGGPDGRVWGLRFQGDDLGRAEVVRQDKAVTALSLNSAGTRLATAARDGTLRYWTYPEGALLSEFRASRKRVTSLIMLPDSEFAVTAGYDATLRLLDLRSGVSLASRVSESRAIAHCALSPEGRFLLTAGLGSRCTVWSLPSLVPLTSFESHQFATYHACFSPEGATLATTGFDGKLVLRSTFTWDVQAEVDLGPAAYFPIALSIDGEYLAAGARRSVLLFDRYTSKLLATLDCRSRRVYSLAFSVEDSYLGAGGNDGRLTVWHIDS